MHKFLGYQIVVILDLGIIIIYLVYIWVTFYTRYRPRFFDQVGHQTTDASMGNKHFIIK